MALNEKFSEALAVVADTSSGPLLLPWPIPGNPGGFISFANFAEWQAFVLRLGLPDDVPQALSRKFERARQQYLLAWFDRDFIKAGELAALIALEYAVRDRYAHRIKAMRTPKPQKKKIKLTSTIAFQANVINNLGLSNVTKTCRSTFGRRSFETCSSVC